MGRIGLLVAAAALLLAGCVGDEAAGTSGARDADGTRPAGTATSSTGPAATSDPPASDQPAVDPAAPGFPPARSAVVVHRRQFSSPTGNITCQLRRDAAACVIAEHD